MSINAEQRKKIFAIQRQHGMTQDDLYSVVEQVSGGRSISQLTKEQAVRVIDRLNQYTGQAPEAGRKMASTKMLWKIRELEKQLGWNDDPRRLQGFMKKFSGVERIEWLTHQKAWKLIESMKKVLAREQQGAV